MTVSYDFYTRDSRTADGAEVTWGQHPTTAGGTNLWHGPPNWEWRYPYQPTTPVIRRKPKKDRWKKYVENMEKIRKIQEIPDVTRNVMIRPVIVCGWCGARIPRGMEDEPCEYCGS